MKRIEDFVTDKGQIDDFLVTYNEFLGKIFVDNFSKLKFRASPVFNKLESQSHFYQRLKLYIAALDYFEKDPGAALETDDVVLYRALSRKYPSRIFCSSKGLSIAKFPLRLGFYLFLTLFLKFFVKKSITQTKYQNIIRTYFISRSVSSEGVLRDEYWGPFADDLAANGKTLCLYKLVDWHDWKKYHAGTLPKKFDVGLVEHFLTVGQIVKGFFRFAFSRIKFSDVKYKGYQIAPILNQTLLEEYLKMGSLVAILEDLIAPKVLKTTDNLFYPFENQAWEKVYPENRSRDGGAKKIIGFQHTGVSFKLLNYFPSKLEKHLPIYPDVILTVGEVIKNILNERAHFSSDILVGAAMRHSQFVENEDIKSLPANAEINKVVTYAFSYDFSLYPGILRDLKSTFEKGSVKVYLKFHPLFSEEYIRRHLSKYIGGNLINALSIPWKQVYLESDIILYDDNTVGFEGMINGIKTYMYKDADKFYDCKRDYYFDLWKHEVRKDDLKVFKNQLESGTYDKTFDQDRLKKYLRSYFSPYVKTKTFEKIKTAFTIKKR